MISMREESSMQEFERLIDALNQAREDLAQGQRDGLRPDEMLARHERAYRGLASGRDYADARQGVRPTG